MKEIGRHPKMLRYLSRSKLICIIFILAIMINTSIVTADTPLNNYTFTTIDVPNNGGYTCAIGINNSSIIVGAYVDNNAWVTHGFLCELSKSITTIDIQDNYTFIKRINDNSQIVGYFYSDPYWSGLGTGFLRDASGNISIIHHPDSAINWTFPYGINNSSEIVGNYMSDQYHGFLRDLIGNYSTLDFPNGRNTRANAINDSSQIVGFYEDGNDVEHGFLFESGSFTTIDFPNAILTRPFGINNKSQIVGYWQDANGISHGFLLYASGSFKEIDVPGSTGTAALGINDKAQIVGYYSDSEGKTHGFIAIPVPELVSVEINIKPGSDINSINRKSKGKIPVAILSTEVFDAPGQVDLSSLTFGSTGDEISLAFCNHRGEDINEDGLMDLVCHFYTQDAGFQCGDTEGFLKGMTEDGTPIQGSDSVRINPCKK